MKQTSVWLCLWKSRITILSKFFYSSITSFELPNFTIGISLLSLLRLMILCFSYLWRFKSFRVKNFFSHWLQTNFLSIEPLTVLDPAWTFKWLINSSWDKSITYRASHNVFVYPWWENKFAYLAVQLTLLCRMHCLMLPETGDRVVCPTTALVVAGVDSLARIMHLVMSRLKLPDILTIRCFVRWWNIFKHSLFSYIYIISFIW